MDPDSGPPNVKIIDFKRTNTNNEHIFYEQNGEFKDFYLAHFNDCNRSLVTCQASFDKEYTLVSSEINVILLENDYSNYKSQDNILTLNDMFALSQKLENKSKYILAFNEKKLYSVCLEQNVVVDISPMWVLEAALKENDLEYMDVNDQILDYICTKASGVKIYKSLKPFKDIETLHQNKQVRTLSLNNKRKVG